MVPMPLTMPPAVPSHRMPTSFLPLRIRSLGHFTFKSSGPSTVVSARCTARALNRGRVLGCTVLAV